MALLIECAIVIIIFTLFVPASTVKNPLAWIGDYPLAIRQRCVELNLIESAEKRFSKRELIRKGTAMILLALVFALVLHRFNGADTFLKGFGYSYLIWSVIAWYDALVVDCLWFCHSKKVRIPGTEDMKEYHDYLFHIKQSCIGMLLGLPVCAVTGLLVMIF